MKEIKKPLLSVGMIVKNESRCLEKCLKALRPLREAIPCELVIADTGSDDSTREIAARYADILFDFPWGSDFSAARNAVMDRCSGKWFLTVDADEYLDSDVSELASFLKSGNNSVIAGTIVQRNYFDTNMEGDYSDFPALRLLCMKTGIHYNGKIHEIWSLPQKSKAVGLLHTVLHHDGYALPTIKQRIQKLHRNLALLEAELESSPNDLRRLLQCCESCYVPESRISYVRRSVTAVQDRQTDWHTYGGAIYRIAIEVAFDYQMPELDDWIEEAKALFSNDPYVAIDGNLVALMRAYQAKNYESVLTYAGDYRAALDTYYRHRYPPGSLFVSVMHSVSASKRDKAALMEADALCQLERWESAEACFRRVKIETCSLKNLGSLLTLIFRNWGSFNFSKILRYIYETVQNLKTKNPELIAQFLRYAAQFFYPSEDESYAPPYPLIAELDCDLGCAAKVMLAETPAEAEEKAAKIQDWKDVPPIVVQKLMDFNIPLPLAFFVQGVEQFETLASGLAALYADVFTEKVLSYSQTEDFFETSARFTWLFDLVIAAVQGEKWERAEPAQKLCDLFCDLAADYLSNFYNAQLLTEEDILMLPAVHRFGWYYMQARNAQDTIEYVRFLRAGLKSVPAMKKMVEFLIEQIEQENLLSYKPDPEFLMLAEKVQTVLAAYSRDDPAVKALMTSPAYQKVKGLIQLPWKN